MTLRPHAGNSLQTNNCDIMEEHFLKLAKLVYKVLEYFPESDPLKNKAKEKEEAKEKKPWVESCGNIYKDVGFSDEEAANLMVRATLLLQLQTIFR